MLLSLDLNCFNRPFDDQSQDRIARETAAIFSVLQRIIDGIDHLSWSAILDFENAQHPLVDRRAEIARWAPRAMASIDNRPQELDHWLRWKKRYATQPVEGHINVQATPSL